MAGSWYSAWTLADSGFLASVLMCAVRSFVYGSSLCLSLYVCVCCVFLFKIWKSEMNSLRAVL